jgi:hypothetical protein
MSSLLKKLLNPRFLVNKVIRVTHNAYWDWKYGGWCGGTRESPFASLGAFKTQSVEYLQLKALFQRANLRITADDVLVDIGCGKGRVINYWLMTGHRNRMVGIEIDDDIASQARHRLQKYSNVTILSGDAVTLFPAEGTIFYLWNPFRAEVMDRFKSRLIEVCGQRGNVTIVYFMCEALKVFKGDPNWSIERLDGEPPLAYPAAIIRLKQTIGRIWVLWVFT